MLYSGKVQDAQRVALMLENLGVRAIPISGQMVQAERIAAVNMFKSGECNILVCSDVGSRGLDIPSVDTVINYTIPPIPEDYIHRVERTGFSILLVNQYELVLYTEIERQHIGKTLLSCYAHDKEARSIAECVKEANRLALKVREELENRGCQIRTGCGVQSVSQLDDGCLITCEDGSEERYSGCILATHAPDTLKMLGEQATHDVTRILDSFNYVYSDIFLHRDKSLIPKNPSAWSSWNFLGKVDNKAFLTYWLNVLQNIDDKGLPFLVTLNPPRTPDNMLLKWTTGHPMPSVATSKASLELHRIQGKRGIKFCGAYQGYRFHEDGLKAGMLAANDLLNMSCEISHTFELLRFFVSRFLQDYIGMGSLIALSISNCLLEEGGTMFTFEGTKKKSPFKSLLIATEADLGLADAYINGDFSFVDKKEGLSNMFKIFILNRDLKSSASKSSKKRPVDTDVSNSWSSIC